MKQLFTILLSLGCYTGFSQWTKVLSLPSSDIFTVYSQDTTLFAGGRNRIYFSRDKGQTWDSSASIPQFISVNNIVVYKNEWYASCYSVGVFKSADGGLTWHDIRAGILPFISGFTEWKGNLYAATLGDAVFQLEPVNRISWVPFQNGLSSLSANINVIASNNNALIAGTNANGLYDYLPAGSTTWEERFLLGQISPSEGSYDITTAHDSLFLAGQTGKFYQSTDNGLTWTLFGNKLSSVFTSVANAKQALVIARGTFDGVNNTSFFYIKKDSLQGTFSIFSSVADHFTYKLFIQGGKLWDASNRGLYFMPLSALPGITAVEDSISAIPAPFSFISAGGKCENDKVTITWKVAHATANSHFTIERETDGNNWTAIGNLPVNANNDTASYSFTDMHPVPNAVYRITEQAVNSTVVYSPLFQSSCGEAYSVRWYPNPVREQLFVHIVAASESETSLRLYDSKGSLLTIKNLKLDIGDNELKIGMQPFPAGLYTLAIWSNGELIRKTVRFLKQ